MDSSAPPTAGNTAGNTTGTVARGATILASAVFLANGGNYLVNVMLGRWLRPDQFSDATLMVTLMLVATAIGVSVQLIAAKATTAGDDAAVRWLGSAALTAGIALGGALVVAAASLSKFFHTASGWPFVILGLGMPCYVMLSVGRGVLQGRLNFARLARTFGIEVVVRAAVSCGLVVLGGGVNGATAGLSASFLATWLVVRRHTALAALRANREVIRRVITIARPVIVLLLAQVIINNEDVLFSKRFLDPATAGRYGALALIGRGVFFTSWAIATAVFPVAASRVEPVGRADRLLLTALAAVIGVGVSAAATASVLGNWALGTVFGPAYRGLAFPLAMYAVVTTLFAVSNLFATYHLSTGNHRPSRILLIGGLLQSAALARWHDSIDHLVGAQLFAMAALTVCIVVDHAYGATQPSTNGERLALS